MSNISIITATHNSANTIASCINSVDSQSSGVEHIFIDGNSDDDTVNIIERTSQFVGRIISEPDDGIYHAMNKGISLAAGDVIGILNSDDYYSSENVISMVEEVFRDPSIDVCYGDLVYINDAGETVRLWRSGEYRKNQLYWGWMPPHPTFFVRRSVYERYGVFNLALGTAADYEIMLRFLLKHELNAAYIPEVLVKMRVGGVSNKSLANRLAANRMDREAWRVNQLTPYPWTLLLKPARKLGQWLV